MVEPYLTTLVYICDAGVHFERPKTNVGYHLSLSESDRLMLLPDIAPSQTLFFGVWVAFHSIEIGVGVGGRAGYAGSHTNLAQQAA